MNKLILTFLCFLVYANSLNGAFVSDDIGGIVARIPNAQPFLYHLLNVSLHCLATILVFYFLKRFFKPLTSLLGASLFAVHPIHAEAVSWISGRPYIIMALITLGIYFFYQYKKLYPLALALFIYYSLTSFHYCILITGFLILTSKKKEWLKWLPFTLVLPIVLFLHKFSIQNRISFVSKEAGGMKWTNPIFNMAYSLFEHTKLLIYPAKLTLYHEPAVITRFVLNCELAILILLLFSLPFIFKKAREVFLAIGIFVLFLGFTYSPVMVAWLVAERYLYLPVLSLSLILCFLHEKCFKEVKPALILFIAIISIYGVGTVARNEDWKTPSKFWRSTVEASPLSPRAHINMGDIYHKEGNIAGAINEFTRATQLKPDYAEAYYNLANVYRNKGETENADKLYGYAISLKPSLKDIKK